MTENTESASNTSLDAGKATTFTFHLTPVRDDRKIARLFVGLFGPCFLMLFAIGLYGFATAPARTPQPDDLLAGFCGGGACVAVLWLFSTWIRKGWGKG